MARTKQTPKGMSNMRKSRQDKKEQPQQEQEQEQEVEQELDEDWQQLLIKSAQAIAACDYDNAKLYAMAAGQDAQEKDDKIGLRDSLEVLGTVELELGELDQAREHFLASISYASDLPSPSPAPHLYLAQLSTPLESLTHFANALQLLQSKISLLEKNKLGTDGSAGSETDVEEESELRRSASRALVGMTELYLTDLCFEPEAEENCEKHLAMAATIDPTDPEVYQTLASVRLSQQRESDAREAALKAWSLWRKLEPESPHYPLTTTRLSLAKLFVELNLLEEALEILMRLEMEDDEDGEVWYLSGWSWWLLGNTRGQEKVKEKDNEDKEGKDECWSEAKLCFENYLRLHEYDPTSSDPEQLKHVHEMNDKLAKEGVVASSGEVEGDEDWEDDGEGDEEGDVEME